MVYRHKMTSGKALSLIVLFLFLAPGFFLNPLVFGSETNDRLTDCTKIENDAKRLRCFDEQPQRKQPAAQTGQTQTPADQPKLTGSSDPGQLSVLTKHWDLDPNNRRHSFVLRPYRYNYFLPMAYNFSPNEETNLENEPSAKAQHQEAKFQLSVKAKVWEDFLQTPLQKFYDKVGVVSGIDIWVGYTQLCFWQLYNSAFSSPFRDSNYEPEMLINFRSRYEIPGLTGTKLQYFNIGLNHQSNGRSQPLSRSWNRIIGTVGLERGNFNLLLKAWWRLPEDEGEDDNPDIIRYMGYGEIIASYLWEKQRFAIMLRNNLRHDNRGSVQLDWSIPPITLGKWLLGSFVAESVLNRYLTDKFSLYVQYFNGYGESLIDYNKSINRIGAGLIIAEWN